MEAIQHRRKEELATLQKNEEKKEETAGAPKQLTVEENINSFTDEIKEEKIFLNKKYRK